MSQENVELARRGAEAFAAGDWETWFEGLAPDIEWEETPGLGPDASVYRGIEEVRDAVRSWIAMWVEYRFEPCDCLDAGDEVVLLAKEKGRSRTGVSVEREIGYVFTFRQARLIRARLYGGWTQALEAAGLSE